jgi:hypothetical protein
MEAFPLAPELMQAFPIGAMPGLLAFVSALSAQHGPKTIRRVCIELAANDALWAFIEGGLGSAAAGAGVPPLANTEAVTAEAFAKAAAAYDEVAAAQTTAVDPAPALLDTKGTSGTEVTNGAKAPPPKKRRSRKDSTNGANQ